MVPHLQANDSLVRQHQRVYKVLLIFIFILMTETCLTRVLWGSMSKSLGCFCDKDAFIASATSKQKENEVITL